jgi:hypothetical protein
MNNELHKFEMSAEELRRLRQLAAGSDLIMGLFPAAADVVGRKLAITVDRSTAEQVRAYLTELLAKVGFDQDYSLTKDGAILEKLIDRFYLR